MLFFVYLALINSVTYLVSYFRGIKHLDFVGMTTSYRLKYMGLGCVLGFLMPFVVCLLTEDIITIGGFVRYIGRFFKDIRKYLPYAIWSAKADLQAEVATSYLNWMWWLIEPVCSMLIYTLIFGVVFHASEDYFTVFVFVGISMWSFFSRSLSASVDIVRWNKDIVTKVYMPKYILLLSKMFSYFFKMLVSFGVIILMMIFFRVPISINVLWSIPAFVLLFLFTFGVSSIMMHYGVFVSDLGYITGILLQMMMYLTGVFYSLSNQVPEPYGIILETFNPVAYVMSVMRNALLYRTAPDISTMVLWLIVSLVLISLGVFTVYSNENSYVKVI
ncbi:ABC transporter permease [Butyrivibrio sp. AE2032]|uniref:ABC transporter permease n=1 Tax=Butyrivibrio sp. AE2032 TaxID=1458463 RepID=UPI000B061D51|nr:ABC transporter permease [Butyrivibrio sp. AE2032]